LAIASITSAPESIEVMKKIVMTTSATSAVTANHGMDPSNWNSAASTLPCVTMVSVRLPCVSGARSMRIAL